jgi:hypothetical protein
MKAKQKELRSYVKKEQPPWHKRRGYAEAALRFLEEERKWNQPIRPGKPN